MARIAHPFLDPVSIRCDVCLYYIEHSQGGVMFVIKCQRRLPLKNAWLISLNIVIIFFFFFLFRLYGFKIHPMAYQLQLQAASSFKSPVKAIR